jgi:hypothetical protein
MANTTTAASPPAARSRHEICELARLPGLALNRQDQAGATG